MESTDTSKCIGVIFNFQLKSHILPVCYVKIVNLHLATPGQKGVYFTEKCVIIRCLGMPFFCQKCNE